MLTCNPVDICTTQVGHPAVVTDGVHDKRQALVHKLMETG